jgi:hypothetical protein
MKEGSPMKTNKLFVAILVSVMFSLLGTAQRNRDNASQDRKESGRLADKMEKPTFEESVDGIRVRLWLMTPAEHKRMMAAQAEDTKSHRMDEMSRRATGKEMKDETKGAGLQEVLEAMMARTQQVIVTLTEEKTNALLSNREISIEMFSPTGRSRSTDLVPMMNHFGGGLTLVEKGRYLFTVTIKTEKETKRLRFIHEIE